MSDQITVISLDDRLIELEDAQRRREERMALCMNAVIISEKENGGRRLTYWRCKSKQCENCREYKGNQYKERILSIMKSEKVYAAFGVHHEVATRLCKRLHKENYIRFPQEDEIDTIFFIKPGVDARADILTLEDVNEIDWALICNQDTRRIISGNLGKEDCTKKSDSSEDSGFIQVVVEDFIAGPPGPALKAVLATSTGVIAWQEPEDVHENAMFRLHYNSELLKQLKLHGCSVYMTISRTISVSDLKINFFDVEHSEIKKH